jgi:FKBP-type peptidyl-prolyl cis-trans isomerase 2
MLKKNDFVNIEYTGMLKEDNIVFDTTNEAEAKKSGIHRPNVKYGPMIICIGQGQVIPGLDKQLVGKDLGKEYSFDIKSEEAFGRKDPKMIQLIATAKFKKANINPMPGLQINIDDQVGVIKTVSGGRTLVDFNHPLSGKDVVYKVKISTMITDNVRKVSSLMGAMLQIQDPEVKITEGKAEVSLLFDLPKEVHEVLKKKILEVLPELKELEIKKKEENKAAPKQDKPKAQ